MMNVETEAVELLPVHPCSTASIVEQEIKKEMKTTKDSDSYIYKGFDYCKKNNTSNNNDDEDVAIIRNPKEHDVLIGRGKPVSLIG